jgi:hypothetical protein
MQNYTEHIKKDVGPAHNWVSYLEWLGVKVEGPHHGHQERED